MFQSNFALCNSNIVLYVYCITYIACLLSPQLQCGFWRFFVWGAFGCIFKLHSNMDTQVVNFQGSDIACTWFNNEPYVAIKHICEAIGIDYSSALQTMKNDEILSSTMALCPIVASDNKEREMQCLPLSYLNGWLFTINTDKVGEQARQRLLAYKRECYRVLFERFFGSQQAHEEARTLHYEILRAEAELKEARLAHKNSDTAQRVKSAKDALMVLQARQTEINSERYGDTLELFSPTV